MRFDQRASDRIDDRVNFVPFPEHIEGRKGEAGLGPEGRHENLPSSCAFTAVWNSWSSRTWICVRSHSWTSGRTSQSW